MKLLAEIDRVELVDKNKSTYTRYAIRGISKYKDTYLLIYSQKDKAYIIPGGGIDKDESHYQALKRELDEECGAKLIDVEAKFGYTVEYDLYPEETFDIYKRVNYYYLVHVDQNLGLQKLEPYEIELGLTPRWVSIEEAIETNELAIQNMYYPKWAKRELLIFKLLKNSEH